MLWRGSNGTHSKKKKKKVRVFDDIIAAMYLIKKGEKPKAYCRECRKFHEAVVCPLRPKYQPITMREINRERREAEARATRRTLRRMAR